MFRSDKILRSLPSVGAFEAHKRVNRLLGGNTEIFASLATYTLLITSAQSDVVAAAARLGRAEGYISRGSYKAALEDVNAVIKNPATKAPELTTLAAAMRLRINNALLDTAEEIMIGSDGSNANEVSDLRGAISNDIEYLVSKRSGCQLTAIAKAEFLMAQGKYAEASTLLDGAIERFSTPAPEAGAATVVVADASNAADIIAFQKSHDASPSKDVVALVKNALNVEKDDDAVALAAVFSAANADHVYIDFFSPAGRYALWQSEAAESVRQSLRHYGGVSQSIDNAVNGYHPHRPTTISAAALEAALSSNAPVMKALSTLPKSQDAQLGDALAAITASCKKYSQTQPKTAEEWATFNAELREQIVARSKTNKAVCLSELKKDTEAIQILNEVVNGDKYLHMWKAFLARGRANKSSGHVDAAENDLKKLFDLKLTHHNHDVPLKDEYRTKSAF